MVEDVAAAGALGIALGVVTGLPIGVVNVAIIDAAVRGERRFAAGIGVGGALADSVHASLAFAGVGHLVAAHPGWARAMAIAASVIIVSVAIASIVRRRTNTPPRRAGGGIATGLVLTLPNPAAFTAWVAVAAALWPSIALPAALTLGAGVGLGSAAVFMLLARWSATLPRDGRVARTVPIVASLLLVAIAVAGLVRAL